MASSATSNSKYFNRLEVNRLEVNNLKVNEEKQTNPEWLFSLIGDATYNASTNTLTLVDNDKLKLLGFTDRPYRQQIEFDDPLQELNFLFSKTNNDPDSFNKDPPNAVLVMNNKQVVYELVKFDTNTFHLKPLPNHSEYYNHTEDYTGEISLFIDPTLTNYQNTILYNINALFISKLLNKYFPDFANEYVNKTLKILDAVKAIHKIKNQHPDEYNQSLKENETVRVLYGNIILTF